MSKKNVRQHSTRPTAKDPRAIAVSAAEEYIAAITQYSDVTDAYRDESPIDAAIEAISQLLHAEHIAKHGPIEEGEEGAWECIGREAGYVVGVQVGLRLRGGAR